MKQEIITYLAGPRNFIQGVELYEKYGINRMLKKSFRRQGETETMKGHSFRGTTEVGRTFRT